MEEGYVIGEVSRWCERISDSYFRERANALSNLGFILTGLFMFWIISGETLKLHSRFHATNAILYARSISWSRIITYAWHSMNGAQWADWLSMIMFISIPWLVNLFTIRDWSEPSFVKIYCLIVGIYAISVVPGNRSWNKFQLLVSFHCSLGNHRGPSIILFPCSAHIFWVDWICRNGLIVILHEVLGNFTGIGG